MKQAQEAVFLLYLDNAATSWPKPESVYRAVDSALRNAANPGRGGHKLAREAAHLVLMAREKVAAFFGVKDPRRVIFTPGATAGLNAVIRGFKYSVGRIISTGFEHNAVWRPLELLSKQGLEVIYLDPVINGDGCWQGFEQALSGGVDLVVVNHASNITGQVLPLGQIVAKAKAAGAHVLADLSQTAGVLDLDIDAIGLDFAAFPGHKGVLGPPGIGVLVVNAPDLVEPWQLGGTGGSSFASGPPDLLPERFESGTVNVPGIAGLAAGVDYLQHLGGAVLEHELKLRHRLIRGLDQLGAVVYGGDGPAVGVVSFNLGQIDSAEVAFILDDIYQIAVRGGLHCCPQGHRWLGTFAQGTVRASPGLFNTEQDIDRLLDAVEQIKGQMR